MVKTGDPTAKKFLNQISHTTGTEVIARVSMGASLHQLSVWLDKGCIVLCLALTLSSWHLQVGLRDGLGYFQLVSEDRIEPN